MKYVIWDAIVLLTKIIELVHLIITKKVWFELV